MPHRYERTPYLSAGSFFLNEEQLALWIKSPYFLDGDHSYLGPLDSAATLSVMKCFRVYKPVLDNAWFLELHHLSARWIGQIDDQISYQNSSATGGTALGQAVWLMLQMPMYRHVFLSDLEWMILPPILLNQFRLFNAGGKVVAFAAWAYLSKEAEARLQAPNPKLAPADWKSGDRLWMVNMFAPYGHGEAALLLLSEAALISQKFRMHSRNRSGFLIVRQYPED